jgi:hypothetical protein
MDIREIFLAIAKANQHPDPEGYADLALSHLDSTFVEPETQPE